MALQLMNFRIDQRRSLSKLQTALVRAIVAMACAIGFSNFAFASGLEGKYVSDTKCLMTVEMLDIEKGMSEGFFKVMSEGDGTCHWKGVGVAKGTHLDVGAVVSLSAVLSFGDLNWVFGPAGDQVQITFFDINGKELYKQTYSRAK